MDGGMLSQPVKVSFKYQDDLMDAYIKEHLMKAPIEKVGGMITFEYFLKVYKTTIVWNRVKFQKQKDEFIVKRRKALKKDDMTQYRQ